MDIHPEEEITLLTLNPIIPGSIIFLPENLQKRKEAVNQ